MYGSGVAVVVVYRAVLCVGRRGGHIFPSLVFETLRERSETKV